MHLDLRHLAGTDLEIALETLAWVMSLCESRATSRRTTGAVRVQLETDRPGPVLSLDGDGPTTFLTP